MTQLPITTEPRRGNSRLTLLLCKVIAFSIYIGGVATVVGLWLASGFTAIDLADARRTLVLNQVSRLMVFLVVPALLATIFLGLALMWPDRRRYIHMRWMQVKLLSLIVLIPSSHLFCETRFSLMRHATDQAASNAAANQFLVGLIVALIGSVWVVILGRLKPRLGQ